MSSQMTILPQTCQKLSQHSGPRKIEILIFDVKAFIPEFSLFLNSVSWSMLRISPDLYDHFGSVSDPETKPS
jgi:hypothetical protein